MDWPGTDVIREIDGRHPTLADFTVDLVSVG